ncbi:tRNA synthetase class I (I, L, M and V) family protein [Actinidia rufa]|uniref:tRNA synthetase class I (I, L, M and V) family protein n=1 Tax=Actinidia rufa TaxID=165716 RepID=A0A7J0F2B6_9ERIC|nr:tRNA synthetase class I (I, L, M and V) family protein [Actinidia rufa]
MQGESIGAGQTLNIEQVKAEAKSGELNSVIDGGWSEFGHNDGAGSLVMGFYLWREGGREGGRGGRLLDIDSVSDMFGREIHNLMVRCDYDMVSSCFVVCSAAEVFYTLMVLSTALFGKPAFRNLICNGLVLAEDGKKMSKRLKNYPSPMEVINDYGADALRLYIINSPVVRAEPLRFKKDGVYGVVKDVFLPWYNAYRFLVQNAKRLEVEGLAPFSPIEQVTLQTSSNVLDQWINSATQSLVHFVQQEMDGYRLYTSPQEAPACDESGYL